MTLLRRLAMTVLVFGVGSGMWGCNKKEEKSIVIQTPRVTTVELDIKARYEGDWVHIKLNSDIRYFCMVDSSITPPAYVRGRSPVRNGVFPGEFEIIISQGNKFSSYRQGDLKEIWDEVVTEYTKEGKERVQ
jgi:hypothetical protein